jgi:hypothetical protein
MRSRDHEQVDRLIRSFDHWSAELTVNTRLSTGHWGHCPVAHSDAAAEMDMLRQRLRARR